MYECVGALPKPEAALLESDIGCKKVVCDLLHRDTIGQSAGVKNVQAVGFCARSTALICCLTAAISSSSLFSRSLSCWMSCVWARPGNAKIHAESKTGSSLAMGI
jgi:hypothetical protein